MMFLKSNPPVTLPLPHLAQLFSTAAFQYKGEQAFPTQIASAAASLSFSWYHLLHEHWRQQGKEIHQHQMERFRLLKTTSLALYREQVPIFLRGYAICRLGRDISVCLGRKEAQGCGFGFKFILLFLFVAVLRQANSFQHWGFQNEQSQLSV